MNKVAWTCLMLCLMITSCGASNISGVSQTQGSGDTAGTGSVDGSGQYLVTASLDFDLDQVEQNLTAFGVDLSVTTDTVSQSLVCDLKNESGQTISSAAVTTAFDVEFAIVENSEELHYIECNNGLISDLFDSSLEESIVLNSQTTLISQILLESNSETQALKSNSIRFQKAKTSTQNSEYNCLKNLNKMIWKVSESLDTGLANELIELEEKTTSMISQNTANKVVNTINASNLKNLKADKNSDTETLKAINDVFKDYISADDDVCSWVESDDIAAELLVAPMINVEDVTELENEFGSEDVLVTHLEIVEQCASGKCDSVKNGKSEVSTLAVLQLFESETKSNKGNSKTDEAAAPAQPVEIPSGCCSQQDKFAEYCAEIVAMTAGIYTEEQICASVTDHKITICHVAGQSGNSVEITVAQPSIVEGHLKHGDTIGACPTATETLPVCGDGKKNGAEQCDGLEGVNASLNQTCSNSCTVIQGSYCGDLVKDESEECDGDDGTNEFINQTCSSDCKIVQGSYCGDGHQDSGEQCDYLDGIDLEHNQVCSWNCTIIQGEYCGDGEKNANEECDADSGINVAAGEECSSNCKILQGFAEVWKFHFGHVFGGFYRMIPGPSAAIGDLRPDLDGLEIATGNEEYYPLGYPGPMGRWFLFESTGDVVFWKDTLNDEAHSSINLFDLDDDSLDEMMGGTTSGNQVQVLDGEGNFLWKANVGGHSISTPAVATESGQAPLVISGSFGAYIRALDGKLGTVKWKYYVGQQIWSSPSIADLDGDGDLELVVASDSETYYWGGGQSYLYCLDVSSGTLIWKREMAQRVRASAALHDLDGDGVVEVLIGDSSGTFKVFSGDTGESVWSFATGGDITSTAAVGDLNEDGEVEIVFGSEDGAMYALSIDGSIVWKQELGSAIYSSPALAQRFEGVERLDVYVTTFAGELMILNGDDGSLESSMNVGHSIVSSPVVGDVDGDGMLEVVFQDRRGDSNGMSGDTLWVIRDRDSDVVPFARPWPMFMANPQHTGVYSAAVAP